MCQYCEEDREPVIACDLTLVDESGNVTTLQKTESMYFDHELSQIADWFKRLLNAAGYDFVEEVKIASSNSKEFSSEDL